MTRQDRIAALKAAAKQRVLILDGAWGVMIQKRGLAEADYRGDLYATTAPTVIGNRVFTPAGGDYTDVPGWLESRDPEWAASVMRSHILAAHAALRDDPES